MSRCKYAIYFPSSKNRDKTVLILKAGYTRFRRQLLGLEPAPKSSDLGCFLSRDGFVDFLHFPWMCVEACSSSKNIGVLQKSVHCQTFLFRGLKRSGVRKKRDVPKKKLASRRNGPMWPRRGFSGSQGSLRNGVGRSWENHFSQPRRIFQS